MIEEIKTFKVSLEFAGTRKQEVALSKAMRVESMCFRYGGVDITFKGTITGANKFENKLQLAIDKVLNT